MYIKGVRKTGGLIAILKCRVKLRTLTDSYKSDNSPMEIKLAQQKFESQILIVIKESALKISRILYPADNYNPKVRSFFFQGFLILYHN